MAAQRGARFRLAGSLPSDLLCSIFDAVPPPDARSAGRQPSTVLSFEERIRAEAVNRHWRAALSAAPGALTRLAVSSPLPGASEPEALAAAAGWAAARARALAARAPTAAWVELDLEDGSVHSTDLTAAYTEALQALLARPGGHTLHVRVAKSSQWSLLRYLAAVQTSPSLQQLELSCRSGSLTCLAPLCGLAGLPHVRRLTAWGGRRGASLHIALPMPRLEALAVHAGRRVEEEEAGTAEEAQLAALKFPSGVVLGGFDCLEYLSQTRGLPFDPPHPSELFPALRSASFETMALVLDAVPLPALERLALTLLWPLPEGFSHLRLALSSTALPALTTLDIDFAAIAGAQVGGARRTSNRLARVLQAAPALRRLRLPVCEAVNARMAAALRALVGLTSLQLGFVDAADGQPGGIGQQGQPQPQGQPLHTLDCQLLAGMAGLQELSVSDGGRLANAAALQRLAALRTLHVAPAGCLPALAPHLPHLTCLQLPAWGSGEAAAQLAPGGPILQALGSLRALRRLVLGGRGQHGRGDEPPASGACRAAWSLSLASCLPAGCEVTEEPA